MTKDSITADQVQALISLCCIGQPVAAKYTSFAEGVIDLAVFHGVGAYCYKSLLEHSAGDIDLSVLAKWKQFYLHTSIKYQKKLKLYSLIKNLLEQAGIPVMALKGMALSSCLYTDEGTRPMGDMDLLVPEGQGMKALQILINAGAEASSVPRSKLHEQVHSHVRAITMHGIMVEIHQRLFSLGSSFCEKTQDYFNHSLVIQKQNVDIKILNNLYMAYHLVAHAAVGIEMGGLRLGWLLDIALLWSGEEDKLAFMNKVIDFKRNRRKELTQVFQMASIFFPKQDRNFNWDITEDQILSEITSIMMDTNVEERHRWINLKEILQTPGLNKKAHLLFREFIPNSDYMRFKYKANRNDSVYRLYLKRILRM